MSNVVAFAVHRQPNEKMASAPARRGVPLEPQPATKSAKAKSAKDAAPNFGAAGRILPHRWLEGLASYLLLPRGVVNSVEADNAEKTYLALHLALHRAYLAKDAVALESAASNHLAVASEGIEGAPDRMSLEIYHFFKAKGCSATADELRNFADHYTRQELVDFFARSAELVSRLKAQALAAIVNGTLAQQKTDLLFQIKAILAFQFVAKALLDERARPPVLPLKLICKMLDIDIFFPEWTFDIDTCRWHAQPAAGGPAGQTAQASPLKLRIDAEQRAAQLVASVGMESSSKKAAPPPGRDIRVDLCNCDEDLEPVCLPPDPCCARINYYVTEALVLRDRTVRYLPSDLAHIENILASESLIREHTFIKTIEDYTEDEITTARSEERDHQVSEKSSVQAEIETNLKMSSDLSAEYTGTGYKVTLDAAVSKDTAQREAREQIREAVDKAVTKLQVDTRKLTTRRSTTTEQEKNTHTFDNTTNKDHVVGKYFYVSKEVEGQVFSHGLRTTVELLIPSPAALYECLEDRKMRRGFKSPCVPDVVSQKEIARETYIDLLKKYCVGALPEPPPELHPYTQDIDISGKDGTDDDSYYTIQTVQVPAGYYGTQLEILANHLSTAQERTGVDLKRDHELEATLSGRSVIVRYDKNGDVKTGASQYANSMDMRSVSDLYIRSNNIASFSGIVRITWTPLPIDLAPWQKQIAALVNDSNRSHIVDGAFAEYVKAYKGALKSRHPFADKEILLAELKRAAIYMMCQEFERSGVMNMKSQPCGYPEINRKAAGEACWDWYFWERAFDWRLMSFTFFDYFWNRMCDWPMKFSPGHDDFMFNAFLRSGMARIQVPVSPGMSGDVIFYLETGQRWGFGGVPPVNPNDPRWVSVIEEVRHSHDCYQNDREGEVTAILDPSTGQATSQVLLRGTDRYWNPLPTPGVVDQDAMNNDVGREIYLDGIAYRIQDITFDPAVSPPYDPVAGSQMEWTVTLDRTFEGVGNSNPNGPVIMKTYAHAIGAEFVGAPFRWQEPTNLIWLSDAGDNCLPTYPVKC